MRNIIIVISIIFSIISTCYSYESTEAQRYYDLAISYIKSDLYEDGLKTLNQVAFLYPDSDVADDALYQLALIREQVGDNKIVIGEKKSLEAVKEELNKLESIPNSSKWGNVLIVLNNINALLAGQIVMREAESQAIAQYILSLDYLYTLFQRYPNSDKVIEAEDMFKRIIAKIDALIPKESSQKPIPKLSSSDEKGCLTIFAIAFVIMVVIYVINAGK
jgi:tetratricopeptide (TPR) repeat protein